ncbi:hypothetical protein TL16_g02630 [Triparma laevis f. inornata]|uniref:Uncharacterized protein n=1 Tax=Triparma laevis f. inornata TaxID=1714386 RepID=A0A9W7DYB0_9STRA|nr:hypothetical protein TL16_g02630 [Triparma laevis f. inornata]
MDTDTNSSWLGFLLNTLKMKSGVTSANITPSDRISNLGVCCLQQVLAFSGPLGVLSVASSSSHLFVTICSSASIFDELHFQAFGVYMRRGVGVGVGGGGGDGSSKTLFFHRLFRSISYRKKKSPGLNVVGSVGLGMPKENQVSKKRADSLPSLFNNTNYNSNQTKQQPFCSILCPPPRQESKFDGQAATEYVEGGVDNSFRLFIGRADGRIEAHMLRLEGGESSETAFMGGGEGRTLSGGLDENVLCLAIDTFDERLYAGGDAGVVRCWDTKTLKEVESLGKDIAEGGGLNQEGSFSAYSLAHFDPNEEKVKKRKKHTRKLTDAGRGNLVIGNLNGSVVVWDIEASAVSAVLLGEEEGGDFQGAICSVAVEKKQNKIVGLAGGGRTVCFWDSEDIWDAVPEVQGSIVVKLPVKVVRLSGGVCSSLLLFPKDLEMEQDGKEVFCFAVGSSQDPVVKGYRFGESLVVGGCDGKVRVWQSIGSILKEGGVHGAGGDILPPDSSFDAVECGGVCPVQGLHSFGNGVDALAMVSIGWDRTVKVLVPDGEEGGGDGGGRTEDIDIDLINMYTMEDLEDQERGEDEFYEQERDEDYYEGLIGDDDDDDDDDDDEEEEEEEEEGKANDDSKLNLDFGDLEEEDSTPYGGALTDRSNFSVDTLQQEVDKALGVGNGKGNNNERGDWRAAMAALDDVLKK